MGSLGSVPVSCGTLCSLIITTNGITTPSSVAVVSTVEVGQFKADLHEICRTHFLLCSRLVGPCEKMSKWAPLSVIQCDTHKEA